MTTPLLTLLPDEKILLLRRKHWLPLALEALPLIAAAILPFLIFGIAGALPPKTVQIITASLPYYFFFAALWLLVLWVVFSAAWTNYYLDLLLVTDKRIITIEQIGIFARNTAETKLQHIQDIKFEIKGFFPSLFRYGDIHIQTAAESREFTAYKIPRPQAVCELVTAKHHELLAVQERNLPAPSQ